MNNLRTFPLSSCKNHPPFFMVHLLHRLYGVEAPACETLYGYDQQKHTDTRRRTQAYTQRCYIHCMRFGRIITRVPKPICWCILTFPSLYTEKSGGDGKEGNTVRKGRRWNGRRGEERETKKECKGKVYGKRNGEEKENKITKKGFGRAEAIASTSYEATLKVRLAKRQRQHSIPPLNLEELKKEKAVQFAAQVTNRFTALDAAQYEVTPEDLWKGTKTVLLEVSRETIGSAKSQKKRNRYLMRLSQQSGKREKQR